MNIPLEQVVGSKNKKVKIKIESHSAGDCLLKTLF